MAEMTLEQQQALALARARRRRAEAQNANLGTEIEANQPDLSSTEESSDDPYANAMSLDEGLESAISPYKSLAGGIWNAGKEAVQTGVGISEGINDRISRIENPVGRGLATVANTMINPVGSLLPSGTNEAIEENVPEVEAAPGSSEEVLLPLTQTGAGLAIGAKGAGLIPKATGYIAKGAKALTGFLGAETGAVATSDKDQQLAITGKDSMLPILKGQGTDEDDTFNDQYLKKSMDFAEDAIVTGAGIGGVAGAAGKAGSYGINIFKRAAKNWRNLDETQKEFVDTILKRAADVGPDATKDEQMKAYQDIQKYVADNQDVLVKFGDPSLDDIKEKADTISVLLNKPGLDPRTKQELESLRSSALSGGSPQLQTALEAPKDNLKGTLGKIEETRGGNEAIEQSRQSVTQSGRQELEQVQAPVKQTEADLATAQKGVDELIRNDPTFGPALSKAEQSGVKLNVNKESLDKQTQVLNRTKEAEELQRQSRNEAHGAIPKDTPADMDSFSKKYKAAKPHLPAYINDLIDKGKGTYEYLQNEVRPALSKYIGQLKQAPNPNVDMSKVIDLQDNIRKTQVNTLTKSGNKETAKAAKAATKADIEYGQKFGQGLGEELKENAKKNLPLKPDNFVSEGRSKLISAIKDPNRRETVSRLRTIVGPEGGKDIDDIIFAEGVQGPMSKITNNKGKLSDVEIDELAKPLERMAENMSDAGRTRAEKFLTDFRNRKWDTEQLKTQLKGFQDAAKEAEDRIYDGNLKDFFTKNYKGEYDDLPNGSAVLEKIFKDPNVSEAKLTDIMNRAPKEGLQAAWAKTAQKMLDNKVDVPMLPEHFEKYGKQVFKDQPLVVDGIMDLNKRAKNINDANKARQGNGLNYGANQTQAHQSVNTIITWMFGVLNPTSARIRTVSNDLMKQYDSKDVTKLAGDTILGNAGEFQKIAQKLIDEKRKELSPAEKKLVFRMFIRQGIYGDEDEKEFFANGPTQDTKKLFQK